MRTRLRRVWLSMHRTLGLLLGAWFALLGLTGAVLVYYRDVDALLDARLGHQPLATTLPSITAAHQALVRAHPERGAAWRIEVPTQVGEPVTARFLKPVETADRRFAPLLVTIDPVTYAVTANRFWGQHLTTWLYDLHYSLLLQDLGRQVVGWGGVACLLSVLTGTVLWWPRSGHWRDALRFKRAASPVRRIYDLHKWTALSGGAVLMVLAGTGAVLALPDLARSAVAAVMPLTPMPVPTPATLDASGRTPLGADQVQALALQAYPLGQIRWIDTPASRPGLFRVRLRQPGEPGDRFPDTLLWIDAISGHIVARRDPSDFTVGDRVLQWMHPLHSGEAFGAIGRFVVCLSALVPVALFLTGWMRWLQKRRARARRCDPPLEPKGTGDHRPPSPTSPLF